MDTGYEDPAAHHLRKARYNPQEQPELAIAEAQVFALLAIAAQLGRIADELGAASEDR